jgi:hypothetical protein
MMWLVRLVPAGAWAAAALTKLPIAFARKGEFVFPYGEVEIVERVLENEGFIGSDGWHLGKGGP